MGNWLDERIAVCQEIVNDPRLAQVMTDSKKMEHILNDSGRLAKLAASAMRSQGDFVGAADMAKAGDSLQKMGSGIGKGTKYIHNATAIFGIYDAWMNIDPATVQSNPQAYTQEFGRLFKHSGNLASTLPFPFSAYAEFLGGFDSFFEDFGNTIIHQNLDSPGARFERDVFPDLFFHVEK